MFKGIFIATLLAVTSTSFAGDLSSVGTTGVEAVVDYSYIRSIDTPSFTSGQIGLIGLQVNAGSLGSVVVEAGDTHAVNSNLSTFQVGYANGAKLGSVNVVGDVSYTEVTGDKWFFSGKTSSLPVNTVSVGGEVNLPVTNSVYGFVNYNHSYTWSSGVSEKTNTGAVGAYVNVSKHIVAKIGYVRGWATDVRGEGVLVSAALKF